MRTIPATLLIAVASGVACSTGPRPRAVGEPAQGAPELCRALAAIPGTTSVDAFAQFEDVLPIALGGVVFELRSQAPALALIEPLQITGAISTRCPSGTQALWIPGISQPEQAAQVLVAAGEKAGTPVEVERWAGFGAQASVARLAARCADPGECLAQSRRVPNVMRCLIVLYILANESAVEGASEACAALPDDATLCAVPALASSDAAARQACVAGVLRELGHQPR